MAGNLSEVAKIMGVDQEMLMVYPKMKFEGNLLNPWGDELLNLFSLLDLAPQKTVLDIPCGQGGVAVYLAKEYGVQVDGYDLLPGFVENANEYAAEKQVRDLCHFFVEDIRTVIAKDKEYDVVLWSAAPHLWKDYAQTVKNLRRCVKPNGYLVIADAYLNGEQYKSMEPDYETLEQTLQSVVEHGDSIIKLKDYKGELWERSYQTDREAVRSAIDHADNQGEKEMLKKHMEEVNQSERTDKEHFGLFILVLKINKN